MTLKEINDTIKALENSSCTFSNCQKLASLYICREYFKSCSKIPYNKKEDSKITDILFM